MCRDRVMGYRAKFADKTKIIVLPFEQLYCYKYLPYWERELKIDYENAYHNINLYIIWNEKTKFVERAIEMNAFDTEYYTWCDIGMFRHNNINHYSIYKHFPELQDKSIDKNKIYLLNLEPFEDSETVQPNGLLPQFIRKVRIGGGVIFGHRDIWSTWVDTYYTTLEKFMLNGYLAGVDQRIMANIAILYPDLCHLVTPKYWSPIKDINDPWFYMLKYFSSAPEEKGYVIPWLMGTLGDQLFNAACAYNVACMQQRECVIVLRYCCSSQYIHSIFKNFTEYPLYGFDYYTIKDTGNMTKSILMNHFLCTFKHIILAGKFNQYNLIKENLDGFIQKLVLPEFNLSKTCFIFASNDGLDDYYKQSIKTIMEKHPDVKFVGYGACDYLNQYDIEYHNDEAENVILGMCRGSEIGCICDTTALGFWGGVLNKGTVISVS
jgi:hypothetical protein